MKYSNLMKERIRRVRVLFKELGYDILEGEKNADTYSAGFADSKGFQSAFFIDTDSKFLEIAFTFGFSSKLTGFIRKRLEEMLKICYEFGCYMNLEKNNGEITFSIFTKLYFSGLNYYSLRDTVNDFRECTDALKELLDIQNF